jgi:hypothetical protein
VLAQWGRIGGKAEARASKFGNHPASTRGAASLAAGWELESQRFHRTKCNDRTRALNFAAVQGIMILRETKWA